MERKNRLVVVFALVSMLFGHAMAGLIDFESYESGVQLVGQDGWTCTSSTSPPFRVVDNGNISTITNNAMTAVLAGEKSTWLNGDHFANRSISFGSGANTSEVSYVSQMKTVTSGTNFCDFYFKQGISNVGEIATIGNSTTGGVVVRVRDKGIIVNNDYSFLYSDVLAIRAVIDFEADTYTVYVAKNGGTEHNLGTFIFGANASGLQADITAGSLDGIAFKMRYGGLVDNVNYVPEPATVMLFGLGSIALFKKRNA